MSCNKKRMLISMVLSCLFLCSTMVSPAHAQKRRDLVKAQFEKNASDALKHAAVLNIIYDQMLNEYVSLNHSLSGKMLSDIKKTVLKLKMYSPHFEKVTRIKLKIVLIYLDFYSGRSQLSVTRKIEKLLKEAPNASDALNTAIILYSCYGEHEKVKDILKGLNGGHKITIVVADTKRSNEIGDPNAIGLTHEKSNPSLSNDHKVRDDVLSNNALSLLTAAMPYELLGQKISSFNFVTSRGGRFQFDAGRGQMLCMLLWRLNGFHAQGGEIKRSDDPRKLLVTSPSFNLMDNLIQFNHLYMHYRTFRKVVFVTGNQDVDSIENWLAIGQMQASIAWPWTSVVIAHAQNRTQWLSHAQYSQLLVLVDGAGIIYYCGPVGGYLPAMLLDRHLETATQLTGLGGMPNGEMPLLRTPLKVTKFTKKLSASSKRALTKPALKSNIKKAIVSKYKRDDDEIKMLSDSIQAQNLLNTATLLKKTNSYNRALGMCDNIIQNYPSTTQEQKAKELIVGILKKKPRLVKYRMNLGLYTGSTLGN